MEMINKSDFFILIQKGSPPAEEISLNKAYKEFAFDILKKLKAEQDMHSVYFVLSYTYAELVAIKEETNNSQMKLDITKKALVFIKTQIEFIRRFQLHDRSKDNEQGNTDDPSIEESPIFWSRSSTDLVELAYAIIESKGFNNGDINVNTLVDYFSNIFHVKVSNCYNIFREIRKRTRSKTLFMDELKLRLEKRIDDIENGILPKTNRIKTRK